MSESKPESLTAILAVSQVTGNVGLELKLGMQLSMLYFNCVSSNHLKLSNSLLVIFVFHIVSFEHSKNHLPSRELVL